MSTTITSKGQVTIPKAVLDTLGLKPGMKVEVKGGADGEVIVKRVDRSDPETPFEKWRGYLGRNPTTDEIMQQLRGDD